MDRAGMFTVVVEPPEAGDVDLAELGDSTVLAPNHLLVVSPLTQSELYHEIKYRLPDGSALFVGRLAMTPKMKGQRPGSVAWSREMAADGVFG